MDFTRELQKTLRSGDFSREDVGDVAALLMLLEDRLPEDARELELVEKLVNGAELSGVSDPAEIMARLDRYFAGRPTERLFTQIAQLGREALASGASGSDGNYGALIGGKAIASVLVRGERPAGSVPAGPGARFAVLDLIARS
jgi:hypothetical protein